MTHTKPTRSYFPRKCHPIRYYPLLLLVMVLMAAVSGPAGAALAYNATYGPADASPARIPPAAPGDCDGLVREGEDATLFGDFEVGYDVAASNGAYIHVPNDKPDSLTTLPASRADLCFTVAEAGDYQLVGRVYTDPPDWTSDSFWVTIDDLPATGYLWTLENNTVYQPVGDAVRLDAASALGVLVPLLNSLLTAAEPHDAPVCHRDGCG